MHPALALFRRNLWATEQLLAFCAQHPEAASAPGDPDVYGGIVPTFNHIVAAETGYFRIVTGELLSDIVDAEEPWPLDRLAEPCRKLAARWERMLAVAHDPELLRGPRGLDQETTPDWLPLVQTVHHADDHRTQINTVLSRHQIEPPNLDGWAFGREPDAGGEVAAWASLLLKRFFDHHLWATRKLLEHCRALSPRELSLSAPGTFGAISETLGHLVSSDARYLSLLRGDPAAGDDETAEPARLLEQLESQAEGWRDYLSSAPDFEAPVKRRTGWSPAWVVVLQAIHHGNDHRTHVGTVLLHHGLGDPGIDVWYYALAEGMLISS